MTTLSFLGLTGLALRKDTSGIRPEGALLVLPPPAGGNDRFWKLGDLFLDPRPGNAYSLVANNAKLVLDGLDITLDTSGDVSLWHDPKTDAWLPSLAGTALTVQLGRDGFAIGPVLIPNTPDNMFFRFDRADPRGLGHAYTKYDWLTAEELGPPQPCSLGLRQDAYFTLDLRDRRLRFTSGTIESRLSAVRRGAAAGGLHRALLSNAADLELRFADIAASVASDKPWTLDLALKSGEVPLNLALTGNGPPPMEVSRCTFSLTVRKRKKQGTAGAMLSEAMLKPAGTQPMLVKVNCIRDTANRPVMWQASAPLLLGFRPDDTAAPTPVLRPVSKADPGNDAVWTRTGKVATRWVHSWFGGACSDAGAGAAASLRIPGDGSQAARTVPGWMDASLCWTVTRAWLELHNTRFLHSRPGEAYRAGELAWRFEGTAVSGALPLLSSVGWNDGDDKVQLRARELFNDTYRAMRLASSLGVHETGLTESQVSNTTVLEVLPGPDLVAGELKLSASTRSFQIQAPALPVQGTVALARAASAPLTIATTLPPGRAVEFALHWPGMKWKTGDEPALVATIDDWKVAFQGPIDPLVPLAVGDITDVGDRPRELPVAILKLGRHHALRQVLDEVQGRIADGGRAAAFGREAARILTTIDSVDQAVLRPDWVGLLLFDARVDYADFPALRALVPTQGAAAPRLDFLAVSPRAPDDASPYVGMSGAIDWHPAPGARAPVVARPARARDESKEQPSEASLVSKSLKVAFRDRRLVQFEARAELTFDSFFGIQGEGGARTTIAIVGSGRRVGGTGGKKEAYEIRFLAETSDQSRLQLLPLGGQAPAESASFVKRVWLRRVEIVDAPADVNRPDRTAEIQIDGAIEFGRPDIKLPQGLEDFFHKLRDVSFTNLRIDLDALAGLDPRPLFLKYPSLSFNLDLPHMGLLGEALKLKFDRLAIDWSANDLNLGQFPELPGLGGGAFNFKLPKMAFFGKIDFGSLPEMFQRTLSGFSLEGVFAINFEKGKPTGGVYVGLGGFGFSGLNFDLLSFLVLKIEHLKLMPRQWQYPALPGQPPAPGPKGAALAFSGLSLEVLGYKVLPRGAGGFFSLDKDGGEGFWALLKGPDDPSPLFNVDWAFVAHNIDFSTDAAKMMIVPPPDRDQGNHDFAQLHDTLAAGWSGDDPAQPVSIFPARDNGGRGWTFAASIQAFNGAFRGRVLIQDGGFTGLALYGDLMKQLFNWDFVFVGLYRHNITPGEDYFYFSITLPAFTVGTIRFTGGALAAEFYTSGDFSCDVGFPWPAAGGGRRWERTLGTIITPGQASAGFYFRKRQQALANGDQALTVGGGFALQWGLGASFGGGVFEVWVRIGVYVILEGEIVLAMAKGAPREITGFSLHGAAGVLAEGYGAIDWWVISVRVSVRASAEIRASLIWSKGQKLVMPIEAELYVSARAEACIGGSCARICRGISVSLSLPVRYQLEFG